MHRSQMLCVQSRRQLRFPLCPEAILQLAEWSSELQTEKESHAFVFILDASRIRKG